MSETFPAPHAENWLGEPLRILFGQLAYPKLVARSFGRDQGSMIAIRPAPAWIKDSDWIALWQGRLTPDDLEEFWKLYSSLLALVATSRDTRGERNFEAHKLTHLYEEVIQASRGSRWVWALTIASSVEGLATMLVPHKSPREDVDRVAIAELAEHINEWRGSPDLKRIAVNAVKRQESANAVITLRNLARSGAIKREELKAWEELRNKVMHGNLVSPYSSKKDDTLLSNLAALMHSLTYLVLGQHRSK